MFNINNEADESVKASFVIAFNIIQTKHPSTNDEYKKNY